ncbi:MAG: phenylalanine--tRNA ligase subunit alpha, partial [Gemmatimonadetes bacterium]|nr:phenylalanine--tRNA ligase subunit alpha [Gemmatimonadota bacterium]NIT66490.1 phenylalanine--tRNA ligase subunit alpha [Gemmatimonadota bacterium]NIU52638.1 phenylalanine--tRNA ligase subunit alpha [Gemmatimonadota bacterium]NIV23035.1 phenylalanine--tRNA ligase subunit alpha [Gemmatimonadota bacterium]NIY35067.1 phenylalanine--tRNA ligase subunit alpha [Gemmatimonadota bacterium]
GELPAEERPAVGAAANRVKGTVTELIEARAAELERGRRPGAVGVDLTLPGRRQWRGAYHP